jgi:hypothetical protein
MEIDRAQQGFADVPPLPDLMNPENLALRVREK